MLYKITENDKTTKNNYTWGENVTLVASGDRSQGMCSDAWIHAYVNPYLALIMGPAHIHGFDRETHLLWEAEGVIERCDAIKVGCRKLTTIRQIDFPDFPRELYPKLLKTIAYESYYGYLQSCDKDDTYKKYLFGEFSEKTRQEILYEKDIIDEEMREKINNVTLNFSIKSLMSSALYICRAYNNVRYDLIKDFKDIALETGVSLGSFSNLSVKSDILHLIEETVSGTYNMEVI